MITKKKFKMSRLACVIVNWHTGEESLTYELRDYYDKDIYTSAYSKGQARYQFKVRISHDLAIPISQITIYNDDIQEVI